MQLRLQCFQGIRGKILCILAKLTFFGKLDLSRNTVLVGTTEERFILTVSLRVLNFKLVKHFLFYLFF